MFALLLISDAPRFLFGVQYRIALNHGMPEWVCVRVVNFLFTILPGDPQQRGLDSRLHSTVGSNMVIGGVTALGDFEGKALRSVSP